MTVFDYFKQICQIPRESGNEEGMRNYLISWAKENSFDYARDNVGNIFVYKKASAGYENADTVVLQGHMDMVCVKTDDCQHDFLKDPIDLYEDGDFLKAHGTSLGGDNGIAVAMVMALFTDETVKHGPLEAMFTYSEETGMDGAFNFDPSLLKGRKLINLDSEEEGIIYIGCAGGIDIDSTYKTKIEDIPSDWDSYTITVSGMLGGHSGGEIHLGRANAIKVLAKALGEVSKAGFRFMLKDFNGGTKRNVIPSQASCTVSFAVSDRKQILWIIEGALDDAEKQYASTDPDMKHDVHGFDREFSTSSSPEDSARIIKALCELPHGVKAMSEVVKGVVETSDNVAILRFNDGKLELAISVRSLIEEKKIELCNQCLAILRNNGFDANSGDGYPGWQPNADSPLAKKCIKAWKDFTGKEPVVTSIHAGLECGVINSKVPGMDSVSLGPNLFDVHSVNEKLSISSTKKIYEFLKEILKNF